MSLKVLPIKEDGTEQRLKRQLHPHLPNIATGQVGVIVSPVKTGKSSLISNLFLNEAFYKDMFDIVYIISNTINNDRTSRFLKKEFEETCYDNLEDIDSILGNIIDYQDSFPRGEKPFIAVVLDDFLGIKKSSKINHFVTRSRHYNCGLLLFASQLFRGLETPVRQNATFVIIGSPNPNEKELLKMAEEYGGAVGGERKFLELYKQATPNKYDFMYIDLQSNPTKVYSTFEKLIYEHKDKYNGGVDVDSVLESKDDEDEE